MGQDLHSDDGEARRGLPPPTGDRRAITPHAGYGTSVALWAPDEPSEFSLNLADYWRLLLKHRILIAVVFVAALALGAIATLMMTPIYTAHMTLQIDREAARVVQTEDAAPADNAVAGEEFFQTQYGLLRSRSLALRVVDSLNLASSDRFLEQMGVSPPSDDAPRTAADRRELVLQVIQENLGVAPLRGSRLVNVSFNSPSPIVASQVANAFGENFIQANLDRRFESSAYAREFLEKRIAQEKAKLEAAERQLVQYAAQQQIINLSEPSTPGGEPQSLATSNLAALNASLAAAKASRVAAEERWRQASGAAVMNLPEVLSNPAVQQLSQTRATLNAEYQQKLSQFKPEFPAMQQLRAQIDELDRQINGIAGNVRSSLRAQYVVALNQERSLQGQVNGLKGEVLDLRDRSVQYNILQREVDTSRTLYEGLLQRYKEIGVTGGVTTNNISVVDRAFPPTAPSRPNIIINMGLAAILGLALGVLAAFIMEVLDESLSTPEDLEAKLGIPVLGAVPLLDKGVEPLGALADIRSPFSEAYYSLRTALQFSTPSGVPRSLLITSARPSEGKSTTALATALNLARVGAKVLLIDGDLRNPSMHRLVAADNSRGLSNILSGASTLAETAQQTDQENLWFIPCGPLPPNPAEMLAGGHVREFLEDAIQRFDVVVIDGPPVLGFADAPVLASQAEGTVMVVESRGTRRGQARGAIRRLMTGNSRILGAVLTKLNVRTVAYGGYDYAYDYHYGVDTGRRSKA